MGEPARGYTRTAPPYEVGNQAARTHGAFAADLADTAAARAAELADVLPWADRPAFASNIIDYAIVREQIDRLVDHLRSIDLDDDRAGPAVERLNKFLSRATSLRRELAASPTSYAELLVKIGQAVAAGAGDTDALAKLQAEGRAILAARGELDAPDEAGRGA